MSWNELTRRQQRILIQLFGGGSLRGDDCVETADLIQRGLVTQKGLTTSGLEVFKAAQITVRNLTDRSGLTIVAHFHMLCDVQFAAADR